MSIRAQPRIQPNGERAKDATSVKLEVKGPMYVEDRIDADAEALSVYSRYTGVGINLSGYSDFPNSYELFVGDSRELLEATKKLKGKWVVVEGDLAVVHGPMRLTYGDFSGPLGRTQYYHEKPRYVIKVRRLDAAPPPEENKDHLAYVRFKVQGVFQTSGKNPFIADLYSKKEHYESVILSEPCDFPLHLGKKDEWLPRAKELNRKPAIVEGDLKCVEGTVGSGPGTIKPGFCFLSVTNLQPAPPQPKGDKE
ncbi:MAG: hypothetical protein SGI86_20470 [Deltaproteobacteria bacterium]|nr:hypothetical protein [Deltaproteobacteria bacterium]